MPSVSGRSTAARPASASTHAARPAGELGPGDTTLELHDVQCWGVLKWQAMS